MAKGGKKFSAVTKGRGVRDGNKEVYDEEDGRRTDIAVMMKREGEGREG